MRAAVSQFLSNMNAIAQKGAMDRARIWQEAGRQISATITQSYQPNLQGRTLEPTRLLFQVNMQGSGLPLIGDLVHPSGLADAPPTKTEILAETDGVPIVEVFDISSQKWMRG